MIDIRPEHLAIVKSILSKYVPGIEVWVFGSRAGGHVKKYSDLDLLLKTTIPLPLHKMAKLQEAFSESDLPWRVDVVDWSQLDQSFREVIQRRYEILIRAS